MWIDNCMVKVFRWMKCSGVQISLIGNFIFIFQKSQRKTALIWIPCVVFWILLPFRMNMIRNSKQPEYKRSGLGLVSERFFFNKLFGQRPTIINLHQDIDWDWRMNAISSFLAFVIFRMPRASMKTLIVQSIGSLLYRISSSTNEKFLFFLAEHQVQSCHFSYWHWKIFPFVLSKFKTPWVSILLVWAIYLIVQTKYERSIKC